MSDQWLIYSFFKGMFSDEVGVEYHDNSYFIAKQFVEQLEKDRAKVRVRVFNDAGTMWAVLPTENKATIAVEQKDLIAA